MQQDRTEELSKVLQMTIYKDGNICNYIKFFPIFEVNEKKRFMLEYVGTISDLVNKADQTDE